MTTMWILVANSGLAQIFSVEGYGKNISKIERFDNPDARKKSSEILSDRPGRAFDSMGKARHSLSTEVDVHQHDNQVFAHKIAHYLEKAKVGNSFDELAVIAPPQFLGVLRNSFSEKVKKSVSKEILKDLPGTLSEHEQMQSLHKYLDLCD